MRADRVEVAQDGDVELGMRQRHVTDGLFDVQLGAAVGIDRAEGMVLGEGEEVGHAVHRGGRAEDEGAAVLEAHFKNGQRGVIVVAVVHERVRHGFAYGLVACEVDDRIDLVFGEQGAHGGDVARVGLDEGDFFAANFLHGEEDGRIAVVEVVHAQGLVALFDELHKHVRAEIAGSAGDENLTHIVFLLTPGLSGLNLSCCLIQPGDPRKSRRWGSAGAPFR